jgi:hypothetical protein
MEIRSYWTEKKPDCNVQTADLADQLANWSFGARKTEMTLRPAALTDALLGQHRAGWRGNRKVIAWREPDETLQAQGLAVRLPELRDG